MTAILLTGTFLTNRKLHYRMLFALSGLLTILLTRGALWLLEDPGEHGRQLAALLLPW